ncbi:hypothetical protein [Clostridium cuniculi]|uniref:hypothetical protein n=1 Tax=Clostridium cuniculi TaxID=2548455 RepID=UPI0010560E41|nr:hypothetical protein [Clostridium cuniculi]
MDNYTRMLELMDKEECKELLNYILQDTVEHIGLRVITNKNTKFTKKDLEEIEYCQNGYRFIKNLLKTYKDERKQVY